ncbi:class I SAM-dependent methyltransferase [Gephyromycinifex aptenodytis]|uniref:class I SAM-dependent methyltransferase n=1 Tax=Gephyromycinifex aptenodytis TaxID=2716227 RepID=UPI001D00AE7A|nr:class I SAM-dependent methyltransferase [Gephyromycinifex aptenodytis]
MSPNIWNHSQTYEIENQAVDPDGLIAAAMERLHDHDGARVLDIGCGAGFHLPFFARRASHVIGVEPHPPLVELARARVADLPDVEVRQGEAEALPVRERSIDVAHARWAYFFGPGAEPGLRELDRVMAPGGTAFVIDNDSTRSTFGAWFARAHPERDPLALQRFWRRHGWNREPVLMRWQMRSRADFEAVVRIEFAPTQAAAILREHEGCEVDYAVDLWWRRYD